MEKYVKAQMEIVEFETEDVITASGKADHSGGNDDEIESDIGTTIGA